MFTLLMVALGALFLAAFVKYTVFVHQAWAEGEGERLGLEAESRGIGTILRGVHHGVPLWLAVSGRRVGEGEAKLTASALDPTVEEFRAATKLFGSSHYKRDAIWAEFPKAQAGDPPDRYADALAVAAAFAARHSLDEIYRIDQDEEE